MNIAKYAFSTFFILVGLSCSNVMAAPITYSFYGPSFSLPLTNLSPNANVSVQSTIFSSDPNEGGEGELTTQFSESGGNQAQGSIPGTIVSGFNFAPGASNANLSVSVPGGDGDETGTVIVDVSAPPPTGWASAKPKLDTASNVLAGVSTLLGKLSEVAGNAKAKAALSLTSQAGGVTATGLQILASDPADSNFTQIAPATIPTLTPFVAAGSFTQQQADALNALISNQAHIYAYAKAGYSAANRATGAYEANQPAWVSKQNAAVSQFIALLAPYLAAEQSDLANVQAAFNFSPVSANDLYAFESGILSNGMPDASQLVSAGFDPLDVTLAQYVIGEQDVYNAAAISTNGLGDPGLLSVFGSASDALTSYTNSTGTTVPEPGTVFLFCIGLVGITATRIRNNSRS
jgi:hypothetical protein